MNELNVYSTVLSPESVRGIADSIGISDLSNEAAKELADDVSYRLKLIIQDAAKFMHHAKRQKLSVTDIDQALKIKNLEPQYGFSSREFIPFRFSSGGGRELNFLEDKEQDITELLSGTVPKLLPEVHLRAHWLCIEGVQPTIPENPPPISKEAQKLESIDPVSKFSKLAKEKESAGKPTTGKVHKLQKVGTVQVKQLATHELSVEQQLYYKEITEACVGSDEVRRAEALQSLASDQGLHEMLPRMCTFIAEGVKVNVVQNNLALLIYLMRMVKALLDNQSLCLEKYLHELLPAVSTCIVSKQLCMRPEVDNHWALRDFASRLMLQICKNFNTSTNNIQTRVTRMFCRTLLDDRMPLASLYGSLQGLSELGPEVMKVFVLPSVRYISKRIDSTSDGSAHSNIERIAAGHIKLLMTKVLSPMLKTLRQPPDSVEDYVAEFGFLGSHLHAAVVKLRSQPAASSAAVTPVTSATPTSSGARFMSHQSITHSGILQQTGSSSILKPLSVCHPMDVEHQASDVSFISNGGPHQGRPIMMSGAATSRTMMTQSNPSKYVIVTSQSSTPNQGSNLGMKPLFVVQPQQVQSHKLEYEEVVLTD